MKILVTGAAGFIGSHLAEKLAVLGHEVTGLDCFTDYYAPALKELNAANVTAAGARILRLDLAQDDLSQAVADVDIIYHAAAQPGISATVPLETYIRNNLTATHRLLEAAAQAPSIKCFINISTSSVYGNHATDTEDTPPKPVSYYGVTKLAAEQLSLARWRENQLPVCSLRLFSVYGPRERPEKLYPILIRSILENTELPLFEGSEKHSRSYTYIDDIIAGLVAVLDHRDSVIGEIFNLGTDIETTTGEGIRIVEEIMGKQARKAIRPKRPGDQLHTHADITKARRLLAYTPKTVPREGLAKEIAWYRENIFEKVKY